EGLPQPLQRGRVIANDQVYMDPANVGSVQIGGPFTKGAAATSDTPSRRNIYICREQDRACAAKILSRMARLAYRRPATAADTKTLVAFFDSGLKDSGTFDGGIQFALERLLVDPDFLLRVYPPPREALRRDSVGVYRLSDLEIASRLSFFLWSSIP